MGFLGSMARLGSRALGASVAGTRSAFNFLRNKKTPPAPTRPKPPPIPYGYGPSGTPGGRAAGGGAPKATPTPPANPEAHTRRETTNERLWKYESAWGLADRMAGLINATTPSFQHAINVGVVGGPYADMRRMWYLACAAAFGRYRKRSAGLTDLNLECVWDVTGKAVSISIGYLQNGSMAVFGGGEDKGTGPNRWKLVGGGFVVGAGIGLRNPWLIAAGVALAADGLPPAGTVEGPPVLASGSGVGLIQEGPDQVTIGENWPDWMIFHPGPSLIDEARRGSGVYKPYNVVTDNCLKLDHHNLYEFWPATKEAGPRGDVISVLGELPYTDANNVRILPYGQIVSLRVFTEVVGAYGGVGRPYGKRERIGAKGTFLSSPLLPDAGRVITTGEKRNAWVQPPKPVLDGVSRMSVVELITAALHDPCLAPEKTDCPTDGWTNVVRGGSAGQTVWDAATKFDHFNIGEAFIRGIEYPQTAKGKQFRGSGMPVLGEDHK